MSDMLGRMKSKANAKVTLTLTLDLEDTWGDDCTIEQVLKTSQDQALSQVKQLADKIAKNQNIFVADSLAYRALRDAQVADIQVTIQTLGKRS